MLISTLYRVAMNFPVHICQRTQRIFFILQWSFILASKQSLNTVIKRELRGTGNCSLFKLGFHHLLSIAQTSVIYQLPSCVLIYIHCTKSESHSASLAHKMETPSPRPQ